MIYGVPWGLKSIRILAACVLFVASLSVVAFIGASTNLVHTNDVYYSRYSKQLTSGDFLRRNLDSTTDEIKKDTGLFPINFTLEGHVFDDNGPSALVSGPVRSSVVYSFSPRIDQMLRDMYFDPANEIVFRATAPALVRFKEKVIVAQRIWLSQYERDMSLDREPRYWNTWKENQVWEYQFDDNYELVNGFGRLMGIPTPINCPYDYRADGVMDPRWAIVGDRLFLTFHLWMVDVEEREIRGRMFLWDYDRQKISKLRLHDYPLQRGEINWTPLTLNGSLYFFYTFDPLRVMRCSLDGLCQFDQLPENDNDYSFDIAVDRLRGGSQFLEYRYPYFIAAAHSQFVIPQNFSYYAANLLVVSVEPRFRIVWASKPIQVDEKFLTSSKIVRDHTIKSPFIYPVGAVLWSEDVFDMGVHLSDSRGYIIRLHGLKRLINSAIEADEKNLASGAVFTGPPVRSVQKLMHNYGERHFGVKFQ